MRKIFLFSVSLYSFHSFSQTTVISDLQSDFNRNRFLNIEHGMKDFSLVGENYTFTNTEENPGPKRLTLRFIGYSGKVYEYKSFWIGEGEYHLTGQVNDESSWKVSPDHPFNQIERDIESSDLAKRKKMIFDHLNSDLGQEKLDKYKAEFSREELGKALELIPSDSWYRGEIVTYLALSETTLAKIGQKAPDFSLESMSGEQFTLSNNLGRYSLLEFSITGCKFCLDALPELKKLQDQFGDQIQIVSIWKDRKKDSWLNVLKEEKSQITWTNAWDPNGMASGLYDIGLWPSYALIDPEGKIKAIWSGYKKGDNLSRKIIRAMETGRP